MSGFDIAESMKPKLEAIEYQIQESYELEGSSATDWLRAVIDTGKWLKAAKDLIAPQDWPRWCAEEPNFSARTIQRRIQFWRKYDALNKPEQASMLGSTSTIRGATKLLESDDTAKTCDIPTTHVSLGGQEVTAPDPEPETCTPETPLDDGPLPEDDEPESAPPEPDPWQPLKQEVKDVFGSVAVAIERLKNQIAIARGFPVFDFVSNILEQDLANLAATIQLSKPTAECPTCRAQSPDQAYNCRTCHSIGLVPKHYAEGGR